MSDLDLANLEARLSAIEDAIRRLGAVERDLGESHDAVSRCRELIHSNVPAGARVAVVSGGEPLPLVLDDRPLIALPPATTVGRADTDSAGGMAAIAQLEVQRARGTRFLLVPDRARSWMQPHAELGEHLAGYRFVADDPAGALLFDLSVRHGAERRVRTLAETLGRVSGDDPYAPVLDWTDLDLGPRIARRSLFTAPADDDAELPYLDDTIDVVIVADEARVEEARRVAVGAVVVVSSDEDGQVVVSEVEDVGNPSARTPEPVLLIVAGSDPEDHWLPRVAEAVAEQPSVTVLASHDPWTAATAADTELVVLAEPGVLPLPGCIDAAVAALRSDERVGGVAVKLLAPSGSLEAAGSMVFADGSVDGVGAGSSEVTAPWHEYVRPVCAGTGLLAVRTAAAREASPRSDWFVAISAALWEAGYEIRYQPDAWAVRIVDAGDGNGAVVDSAAEAWPAGLPARPERPATLDARVWRALLATDDVEGSWQ
jgi:hypothetical protein